MPLPFLQWCMMPLSLCMDVALCAGGTVWVCVCVGSAHTHSSNMSLPAALTPTKSSRCGIDRQNCCWGRSDTRLPSTFGAVGRCHSSLPTVTNDSHHSQLSRGNKGAAVLVHWALGGGRGEALNQVEQGCTHQNGPFRGSLGRGEHGVVTMSGQYVHVSSGPESAGRCWWW